MMLNFQTFGQGSPVVLLHGLFGSGDNLRTIALGLSERHAVWLPDARNHGGSPHASEMDYDLMSEDLRQFLLNHEIPRVSLVGHSMGGKIAMRFALLNGDFVDRLAVVDIAPRQYPPRHLEILEALLALELDRFQDRRQIEDHLAGSIPELSVRRFLLKNLKLNVGGGYHWSLNLPAINAEYPKLNADVTGNGGKPFSGSTLFIRGELSDYFHETDQPQIQAWFPSARFCAVPGARHWVHADAPRALLSILCDFLD